MALKTLTHRNSALSAAKSCYADTREKVEEEIELRKKVKGKETNQGGGKKRMYPHKYTCVVGICSTTKWLCYEPLPEAEQITINGTISKTCRGGIQIKGLLTSHVLSLHLHNYGEDTEHSCVCL